MWLAWAEAAGLRGGPPGERVGVLRRVVITGLGCVTPCGVGVEDLWDAVVAGRSAVSPLTSFDPAGCRSQVAGEVLGFRPEDFLPRREVHATPLSNSIIGPMLPSWSDTRRGKEPAGLRPNIRL